MSAPMERHGKQVGLTRATADKLLRELLERAESINADPGYLYRVSRLAVFGSYLSDKPTLGDLDIAVELQWRVEDVEERQRLMTAQSAAEAPRHLGTLTYLCWPLEKVYRGLKKRNHSFSFHTYEEYQAMRDAGEATGKDIFPVAVKKS